MNKYLFGFILTLTIIGCKKDDASAKKDYRSFLATESQTFMGNLDGTNFSWSFGYQFQSIEGALNVNGICDSTDPVIVVFFGLTSEDGGKTNFRLFSPKYNSYSDTEFSKVFSLGIHKLGNYRTDFYLSINRGNTFYQSNSLSQANEIEILKTQEFTDNVGKKLRVWFRIDTKLSSCDCQNNQSVLSNGLLIAEFYGFKKE